MLCKDFKFRWDGRNLIDIIVSSLDGRDKLADFSERLLEAETAMAYGIPFDNSWYSMSTETRCTMIAGRVGRAWMSSLQEQEIMAKATK